MDKYKKNTKLPVIELKSSPLSERAIIIISELQNILNECFKSQNDVNIVISKKEYSICILKNE